MEFLVLGCNGMAGHMVSLYLKSKGYNVTGFARKPSPYVPTIVGDAVDFSFLKEIVEKHTFDAVINCVGILNQFAEQDHPQAILLNSYLPHYLAAVTNKLSTQIVHISTDCVFSGEQGGYTELSFPDGKSFYDRTKALGELNDGKNVTLRTSIVGPDLKPSGIGLMNWFLQQKVTVSGFSGALWTGQTTLQLAKTIEAAVLDHAHGLYNAVPNHNISKYELLKLFNKYIRNNPIEIKKADKFIADKTLVRTRWDDFDYSVPGYETMVKELGIWMKEHKRMYPQYDL